MKNWWPVLFFVLLMTGVVVFFGLVVHAQMKAENNCGERGGVWTRAGCLAKECTR